MKSRVMITGDENKRIAQLEDALMLMVYQYCVTDNRLDHLLHWVFKTAIALKNWR